MKNLPLHWKIIIGMFWACVFGLGLSFFQAVNFYQHFIKPFGTIFINLLKLIAIPLILASLIKGVSDLKIYKTIKNGWRTIVTYMFTTVIAVIIGLVLVN